MLIVLIGPKGSGKSHIGRLLESRLGVNFIHVEPLWLDYYARCREEGTRPTIPGGIRRVHPVIDHALGAHKHVCIETTGASREIVDDLLRRGGPANTVLVRVDAPLALCMERIASRDQTHQVPMDIASIRRIHELSRELDMEYDVILENGNLTAEDILRALNPLFQGGGGA